ncbi:sensor histidine kinase [Ruminococcus flavefaciens]|uniref:sensor histidine kinase n=1 Tax=Ruminococcus flavefaciens TaxID=1265 RepID=UPI0004640B24|nr:HAMP domain-containing sensor histidine kinase [Ruminococcus flavefaciens]
MLYGLLAILLTAAVVKIIILKKSAREIADEFADRLDNDTNTLIDISSHDRDMLRLANSINEQLRVLRKEHLQYHLGNTELKTAITNISHDIRTPLTAICGYLYLIKKTDDKELIHSYLEIIGERTETMKQLTEELFRYSVIVSDETEAEMQEVRVNQVLEDCIMGYCGALDEKGIVPEVHITENTIVRMVNKASLERVFSNLLNNALKYSDGDLEITLSDTGEITFSNTSQRLSAVEVEQLFDRFYTVEAARNSTGLGLSIARTLVERMGGTITASYDNKRLTIRIKL